MYDTYRNSHQHWFRPSIHHSAQENKCGQFEFSDLNDKSTFLYRGLNRSLNIGGKIIDNDKELATKFNEFFVNVGPSTENTIPKVPNISPSKFLKNRNQTNFIIAHISNEQILDIINSLENKSTGPSSIPVKLLSMIPDLIIIPLAYIINLSLSTGVYPELLKIVKVIPIHKGGSTQDVNNYRPISLINL